MSEWVSGYIYISFNQGRSLCTFGWTKLCRCIYIGGRWILYARCMFPGSLGVHKRPHMCSRCTIVSLNISIFWRQACSGHLRRLITKCRICIRIIDSHIGLYFFYISPVRRVRHYYYIILLYYIDIVYYIYRYIDILYRYRSCILLTMDYCYIILLHNYDCYTIINIHIWYTICIIFLKFHRTRWAGNLGNYLMNHFLNILQL